MRWRIEDWHRVLEIESGCAIETLPHKTRTRLERAIAIRHVIVRRNMLMSSPMGGAAGRSAVVAAGIQVTEPELEVGAPVTLHMSPRQAYLFDADGALLVAPARRN